MRWAINFCNFFYYYYLSVLTIWLLLYYSAINYRDIRIYCIRYTIKICFALLCCCICCTMYKVHDAQCSVSDKLTMEIKWMQILIRRLNGWLSCMKKHNEYTIFCSLPKKSTWLSFLIDFHGEKLFIIPSIQHGKAGAGEGESYN